MALINANDLVLGNGDLFLDSADNLANLPTVAAYKAAFAAGTLPATPDYTGAMKGTATIAIQREPAQFETGVPQEVSDQTVIREGLLFKCILAELTLKEVFAQIGGGIYTANSAGVTLITNEDFISHWDQAYDLKFGPLLDTTTVPSAAAPIVKNAALSVTYTFGTDYIYDLSKSSITPLSTGTITNGQELKVTYNYNQLSNETLTVGGQSSINTSALRFFHPFKWGGVLALTIYKANPAGNLTMPFEEIAYSFREIEFKAIANFANAVGNHLFQLYLDVPPQA
jgi:hypothetical protein